MQQQQDSSTPYPPQPPAPEKSRSTMPWIIIGVIVLAIIVFGIVAAGFLPQTSSTTQSSSASTPKIGVPFVVDSTWTVTVNSVKTSQGDEFDTPKAGNIFVVIDVTLKNTSTEVQHASGLGQWNMRDNTGQNVSTSLMGKDPGGAMSPGSLLRGQLSYEVPKSEHSFILQFVPDPGASSLTEWNISI